MTISRSSSRETRRGVQPRTLIRLGLDASPLRVGYAITIDDVPVSWGTQHIPRLRSIEERRQLWRSIRDEIRQLEREHRTDLAAVGIEAPYIGPNRMGSLNHARNIGHHEAFAHLSFPYAPQLLIYPAEWRRLLGLPGKGKEAPYAYAEAELAHAQRVRGYARGTADPIDQDSADAICIAKALAQMTKDF